MKRKSCETQSLAPAKRSARAPASPYSPAAASEADQNPKKRCWAADDTDMQQYHDHTWGRPETDESRLFESQTLQLMQCGVSWGTVWRKREHFRRAFKNYDVVKVAGFNAKEIDDLMAWPDGTIIRNRSKLRAVVQNAQLIVSMMRNAASGSGVSFAELLWSHCPVNDKERLKTIQSVSGSHMRSEQVDSSSYETREVQDGVHPSKSVCALSRELKRCGFGFMGPTTVLSFMQVCHRGGGGIKSMCVRLCTRLCLIAIEGIANARV
jgi:DNA-3-methyladenine glycosylase I